MNDTSMTRKTDPKYDDDLVNKRYIDKINKDLIETSEKIKTEIENELTQVDEKLSVDYIVEEGTSGNWSYRKWNSGIAECWGKHNFTDTTSKAWGSLYRFQNPIIINYPFEFKEIPIETYGSNGGATIFLTTHTSNSKTNSCAYNICYHSNTTISIDINLYIVGKWK